MSTRGALIEREGDIDTGGNLSRNHNVATGIPLVLIGRSDFALGGDVVHAMTPAPINSTSFQLDGFNDFFFRIFYNEEHP